MEAGVGGNVTWHSGSIDLVNNQQEYDMTTWAAAHANLTANDSIEIKRIFYEAPPAITRYFDPYAGSGTGTMGIMDSFGWGSYSPAINFMMMPINYDLQVMQAIEFNDQIRRSNYSFELINNMLKLFPIPNGSVSKLHFQYIKLSDRNNPYESGTDKITNVSNVPFVNPSYNEINSIGRQWIFEYTLSIAKEILGYVRGKYDTIPIPDSNVTLNHGDLIAAATSEKTALIEKLRTYLDETSKDKLMERRDKEADYLNNELNRVPYTIFIG